MTESIEPRTVEDSRVEMNEIVLPEDSNARGSIFGGRVLALLDKCAAISALRYSRRRVVTVSMDSVTFVNEVRVGHILNLRGRVNAAFGSSMEIEVEVHSENPLTGERKLTTRAFVTMVALDKEGRPCKAPPLQIETADETRRAKQAAERRAQRLKTRS